MRVFVYECVSAGGLGPDVPASLLREGWAMLDAVCADFRRVTGVEVVTLADQSRFRAMAASCDWTMVIAPELDGRLGDLSESVLAAKGRLLGSMPDAIRLTADKFALAHYWLERGIRHPRTELLDSETFASFAPPWVIKLRHGAGSQGMFHVHDREEAHRLWPILEEHANAEFSRTGTLACPVPVRQTRVSAPLVEFIVQQFVRGQPASVALLIGPAQTIPLVPARQHLSQDGRFRYEGGSLPLPPELAERAIRVALTAVQSIAGLQGYVGVDLVLGENGEDFAIEINPRLTTSYIGLRQLCRSNLAELMLNCARGETMEPPQWNAGEVRFGTDG